LSAMTSIGYRESAAVLRGEMTVEEAKVQMRRSTRVFVRRQANWFKANDPSIHWFEAGNADLDGIVKMVQAFLDGK
jgi:tRNA dimethylallyltransferase